MDPQNTQNNITPPPDKKTVSGFVVAVCVGLVVVGAIIPGEAGNVPLILGIAALGGYSGFKMIFASPEYTKSISNPIAKFLIITTCIGLGLFIFLVTFIISVMAYAFKNPDAFQCG